MMSFGTARLIARRAAVGVVAGTTVGGLTAVGYTFTESGLGWRREIHFWSVVSPVVFDYWWNASSSSPYVKYKKKYLMVKSSNSGSSSSPERQTNYTNLEEGSKVDSRIVPSEKYSGSSSDIYQELHERNAPRIFRVILELGGLYIKLGQVLSVTALPIPEQYRELFRTLQSNVPGHDEFQAVIKPTLEKEFGRPLEDIFESIDEIPCGAASIGQAHKATLKDSKEQVILKVQYPRAKWQVPADIQCVGDFMKLCVYFGLIDENAANLSFQEFSRQFLMELDYVRERQNLEEVYDSSVDPNAPYIQKGVVIPRVFPDLCTNQVITMTYLPGPKFEEEAKQQLALLGFDTKRGIRDVVQEATKQMEDVGTEVTKTSGPVADTSLSSDVKQSRTTFKPNAWQISLSRTVGSWLGVDFIFAMLRVARKAVLLSRAAAVSSIQAASKLSIVPSTWIEWANDHEHASLQAARLDWTHRAIYALLDVHGYQILNKGLFNADPHPGNILVIRNDNSQQITSTMEPKIGLIDYGQCKRLTTEERIRIAKLILSVADNASDDEIAANFRRMGIQTKNDSTEFLAQFARLMFGAFKPQHLDHDWHIKMHRKDKVLYFPNELSMVYRTSLLLRGLAMSLQLNVDVGNEWRHHAQLAIQQNLESMGSVQE